MLLSNKVFVISIANCSRLMFRTEQTCSNVRRALILVAADEHNHPLMLEIIAPDRLARGLPSYGRDNIIQVPRLNQVSEGFSPLTTYIYAH